MERTGRRASSQDQWAALWHETRVPNEAVRVEGKLLSQYEKNERHVAGPGLPRAISTSPDPLLPPWGSGNNVAPTSQSWNDNELVRHRNIVLRHLATLDMMIVQL